MKRFGLFFILVCAITLSACTPLNTDTYYDMPPGKISVETSDPVAMLSKVKGAVVGIAVSLSNGYTIGSGVAVSDGGYVLTNNHVVESGGDITLFYADLTTGSASVLWKDAGLDLAIIKSSRNLPYLETLNSSGLKVGEDIFAIGTPLTLQFKHTVTKGIISAMQRTLQTEGEAGVNFMQSLIQHDASINPGNSGGPLITTNGKLVGINTLKASEGEGLGFAIPIEVANAVVKKVTENNAYKTPYIGIFGFDKEMAAVYGNSVSLDGVYVIDSSGPSLNVGIKKGDIVTKLGEYQIKTMLDFKTKIYEFNAGDKIEVTYIRDGKENVVAIASIAK